VASAARAPSPDIGALDPGTVVGLMDAPAGAYVHVPFCSRICPFCPYNKVIPRAGQPERYFDALVGEIRSYVDAGAAGRDGFTSLYVGGGTPTLFPDALGEGLAALPVAGERAIEVLPSHGTPDRLDTLRALGFSAVSIGAQSFSDEVLRHLRRPHDAASARSAVAGALGRFDVVDVDLIVDVEFDDRRAGSFLRDLEECFDLGVDQVSTYPLMRFGYTPFGRARHHRRREHEILAVATGLADAHGYERRSVWTFNRRSSAPYTSITRRRFLGFGAGASSFLGRDFLVNHFGVETYIASTAGAGSPIARRLHLGGLGAVGYDAFWQAYAGAIDIAALRASYGGWAACLRAPLALGVLLDALAAPSGRGVYALTPRGFDRYHDLERWVTYHLIEPLWAQMLAEHTREGSGSGWVDPVSARRGRLWWAVSRALERPVHPARQG